MSKPHEQEQLQLPLPLILGVKNVSEAVGKQALEPSAIVPVTSVSRTDAMIQEMAVDYAAYVNIDMNSELKGIHESVNEMQLRLEEFNSILGMMQANSSKSIADNVPRFHEFQPHLDVFCKRVDALEGFVARANADLVKLEANVEASETALGTDGNRLAILNPLSYFKKSSDAPTSTITQDISELPTIFKTEDYFNITQVEDKET